MNTEECLRQADIKVTKGRVNILQCFFEKGEVFTAEDIYFILRNQNIKIDLSTIYRTLDLLHNKKVLSKLIGDNGTFKFMLKSSVHKHIIECSLCHKEVEYECPMFQIKEILEKEIGFYVTCGDLELQGICDKCRQNKDKK